MKGEFLLSLRLPYTVILIPSYNALNWKQEIRNKKQKMIFINDKLVETKSKGKKLKQTLYKRLW
jgi:hypothetical protein